MVRYCDVTVLQCTAPALPAVVSSAQHAFAFLHVQTNIQPSSTLSAQHVTSTTCKLIPGAVTTHNSGPREISFVMSFAPWHYQYLETIVIVGVHGETHRRQETLNACKVFKPMSNMCTSVSNKDLMHLVFNQSTNVTLFRLLGMSLPDKSDNG